MSGATIEDLDGLVVRVDALSVPFGSTIWNGAKLYVVERAEEDWAGTYLRCQPLDGGDPEFFRHSIWVVLHGAIK